MIEVFATTEHVSVILDGMSKLIALVSNFKVVNVISHCIVNIQFDNSTIVFKCEDDSHCNHQGSCHTETFVCYCDEAWTEFAFEDCTSKKKKSINNCKINFNNLIIFVY